MKAAIYARVSTKKQELEMQRREVEQYCRLKGWTVHEIYEEKLSGKIAHRPELVRLLRAAVQGSFGVVLVWKFDRLARSARQLLEVMEQLHHLGIAFVSVREGFDTSTPFGKAATTIIAAMAELEAESIRERVTSGIEAAHERLKDGPYRRAKDGKLVSKFGRPFVAVDAYQVAELRRQGQSWKEISKKLGVGSGTARRALLSLAKSPPDLEAVTD